MTHLRCGSGLPQRLAMAVTLTVSMAGQAIGLRAEEVVAENNQRSTINDSPVSCGLCGLLQSLFRHPEEVEPRCRLFPESHV